jgi:hypothetical protein
VLRLVDRWLGAGFAGSAVAVLLGSLVGLAVLGALVARWRFAELDQLRGPARGPAPGRHRAH